MDFKYAVSRADGKSGGFAFLFVRSNYRRIAFVPTENKNNALGLINIAEKLGWNECGHFDGYHAFSRRRAAVSHQAAGARWTAAIAQIDTKFIVRSGPEPATSVS